MVRNESEGEIFKPFLRDIRCDIQWAYYDVWRNRVTFHRFCYLIFFITYEAIWLIAVSKCFP